jgi:hypothetical protein
MFRMLIAGVLAFTLPLTALAAAVVESLSGAVQVGDAPVRVGHKVAVPTSISTGAGAQAFLRFEDGMQIVLGENSLLRVVDFRFTSSGVTNRAVFDLLRGSARVVTGKVASTSPRQFFFRLPQTQLTVERPADFTVALVNPAYVTVNVGSVVSSNTYGVSTLSAGSTSTIATNAAAATTIPTASLPAGASSAMSNLSLASMSAPSGAAASGVSAGMLGGAAAETPTLLLIGIAAAVAVGVAIVAQDDDSAATPQH